MSSTETLTPQQSVRWDAASFRDSVHAAGMAASPPILDGASSAVILGGSRPLVNFAGCSFLSMHTRDEVIDTFVSQAPLYGLATGGSRMIQGKLRPHVDLEEALVAAMGKPAAMTFASGLLANVGFVHAMSKSMRLTDGLAWDVDDVVFILDRSSHWSMWKALEGLKFGERVFAFRHNDLRSLEQRLAALDGQRAVIMFESVYSDDGSIAPIKGIVDLARRYDAVTFVDDANGFLVYGGDDLPFADDFAALPEVTFHMVSLSKAVGLEGGAIAGPPEYIEIFEWLAGTSSFTATMLPPAAAAATRAIELIVSDRSILERYHRTVHTFRTGLAEAGFELNPTPSYITTVHIGAEDDAEQVREMAHQEGYLVPIFRYPAVRRGRAGLRLMASVDHTDEHIDGFVQSLTRIRHVVGF